MSDKQFQEADENADLAQGGRRAVELLLEGKEAAAMAIIEALPWNERRFLHRRLRRAALLVEES